MPTKAEMASAIAHIQGERDVENRNSVQMPKIDVVKFLRQKSCYLSIACCWSAFLEEVAEDF